MKKAFLIFLMIFGSAMATAKPLGVAVWDPAPGKAPQMLASAQAAAEIHRGLGATVAMHLDTLGRLHYVVAFEDWDGWARFNEALPKSDAWRQWQGRAAADPAAKQVENYFMEEVVSPDAPGRFTQIYLWEPLNGNVSAFLRDALQAREIHEAAGVDIAINVDQMNRVHYVMSYPSHAAFAAQRKAPNADFQAFSQRFSAAPIGRLVEVYTVTALP